MFIRINNVYIACNAIDHAEFIPQSMQPGYGPESGEPWDTEFHTGPSIVPAKVIIHTLKGASFHECDPGKVSDLVALLNSRTAGLSG